MLVLLLIAAIIGLLTTCLRFHRWLSPYFPSNLIRDRVWTREGLKWGVPAMLLSLPYFGLAYWLATVVEAGGPSWLNFFVLLCAWSGFKLLWLGPLSLVVLTYVRIREGLERYRAGRRALDNAAPRLRAPAGPEARAW